MSRDVVRNGILGVMTSGGVIVGAGVLIEGGHVVTCRHVLQAAIDPVASAKGREVPVPVGAQIRVRFHLIEGSPPLKAEVLRNDEVADLALLRFMDGQSPPKDATPIRFVDAHRAKDENLRAYGFPNNSPVGAWSYFYVVDQAAVLYQLNPSTKKKGMDLQPGFSGTAVFLDNANSDEAFGLVVAAHKDHHGDHPVAFMIPTAKLREFWPQLAVSSPPAIPPAYLQWVRAKYGGAVSLLGMDVKQAKPATMDDVYVPLTTPQPLRSAESPEDTAAAGQGTGQGTGQGSGQDRRQGRPQGPGDVPRRGRASEPREQRPTLLLDLLDEDSLYVTGAPGAGKSWFSRWVALLVCRGQLPSHDLPPPKEFQERFPAALAGRLPLLVPLREFWDALPHTPGGQDLTREELERALAKWLDAKKPGGLAWADVQRHLHYGSALLIFDGVDEVPRSQGEDYGVWHPHDLLISGLAEAIAHWRKGGNRILVTSRPYGVSAHEVGRLGLPEVHIGDLPTSLQRLLVQRWFSILERTPAHAKEISTSLLSDLGGKPDLQQAVANPLFLTAVCVIYSEGEKLPNNQHDLYRRVVSAVLASRFAEKERAPLWRRLCVVAHGMHTGENWKVRPAPVAETGNDEIELHLEVYGHKDGFRGQGFATADQARQTLLAKSGLLIPRSEGRSGYYHFSLQEHLAAAWMATREGPKGPQRLADVFIQRAPIAAWHNTLSFFFGALLANEMTFQCVPEVLDALTDCIRGRPYDETVGLQIAVGGCLQLLKRKEYDLRAEWVEVMVSACLAAIDPSVPFEKRMPIPDRQKMGLCLGALGDPRIVVDLRDKTAFAALPDGARWSAYVQVPAGDYVVGDDENRRQMTIPRPFLLSRFPVTNAQFRLFVEEQGYEDPKWWIDDQGIDQGWKWREKQDLHEPRLWRDATWNGDNQPVVGVSWYEAAAFARWAGARLPSEWEWEAAARGPEGFQYPWGDTWQEGICNSCESKLGVTSPVGFFPDSASQPLGFQDLAGNVWEWCVESSFFEETPARRMLRGGSWYYSRTACHLALRDATGIGSRSVNIGFRLAADA